MQNSTRKNLFQAFAVVLFICASVVSAAPTLSPVSLKGIGFSKQTCLHKDSASKSEWKTCIKPNAEKTNIPSYDDLSIDTYISSNTFHEMQVPEKSVPIT